MNSCYPRRTAALILFLALSLLLLAPAANGRPEARAKFDLKAIPVQDPTAGGDRDLGTYFFAATGAGAFGQPGTNATGYDFEGVEPAGWYAVAPGGEVHWHMEDVGLLAGHDVDMSGALPFDTGDTENSFALWCGTNTDPSFASDGYGNNWDEAVVVHFDLSVTTDVTIDFYMNCDFEGDSYDYFQVEVSGADGTWTEIYLNDTPSEQNLNHIVVTVDSADIGGWLEAVRFRFRSDSSWSDEDGSFISDIGAVWIDNLIIEVDGSSVLTTDFEDEVVPDNITMLTTTDFDTENYTLLHDGVEIGDDCWDDTHSTWGFFDPETTEPAYPDGVVSYGPPYAYMVLQSPALEVDQTGAALAFVYAEEESLQLNMDGYFDLPLDPLIYLRVWVSAREATADSYGNWQTDNTLYYSWQGCETPLSFDIRDEALASSGPGTMIGLKVRIELVDMCPFWCNIYGSGTPHTVGMLIDGVSIGTSTAAPEELMPVAIFDATPNPAEQDETVSFDASSSYHNDPLASIVDYEWDFGDGSPPQSGSSPLADHVYTTVDTFIAILTVTDDSDPARTDSTELNIVVEPASDPLLPVAVFVATPNPAEQDETVSFDASSSFHEDVEQSIVTYEWDFDGDGSYDQSDASPLADHVFTEVGVFSARLRVTDDSVPVRQDSTDLDIVVESLGTSVPEIPNRFQLYPNVPNPFNPSTKLRYDLAVAGEVSLSIFDITGRKLRDLVQGYQTAGSHEVTWDGRNQSGVSAPSGVYFARMLSGNFVGEQRLTLLK